MAIERKNSFHLLLSDDELNLLRLLAEREGLNASDYLRSLLRQMAGANPQMSQVIRIATALSGRVDLKPLAESLDALSDLGEARAAKKRA